MDDEKNLPLITVGISTYNRKGYLADSIRSVQKQTYPNLEIIVVDDGSTDGTEEMMHKDFPDIVYVRQKNAGDASAKNKAAQLAHGKYIVFNDSDDLFLPFAVEKLYNALPAGSKGCSYGSSIRIDKDSRQMPTRAKMKHFPSGNITKDLIRHIIVNSCGTLIPVDLFRKTGGYDSSYRVGFDYKFALELSVSVPFYSVDEPVFLRRRHDGNLSAGTYDKLGILLEILTRFFEKHPDIQKQYAKDADLRLADMHCKLAREARKEKRGSTVVRKHLRESLKHGFSFLCLWRYLGTYAGFYRG